MQTEEKRLFCLAVDVGQGKTHTGNIYRHIPTGKEYTIDSTKYQYMDGLVFCAWGKNRFTY